MQNDISPLEDENSFNCQQCHQKFTEELRFSNHMKTVHDTSVDLLCEHCGEIFMERSTLRYHIETIHKDSENYKCPQCEQT